MVHVLAAANAPILERLLRIDAVDGRSLDLHDKALGHFVTESALERARIAARTGAYTILHHQGELLHFDDHFTPGAVACAMSHYAALRVVAFHPTADWGLILEDDITAIVPNVKDVIRKFVQQLPENWDAVFLGYHGGKLANKTNKCDPPLLRMFLPIYGLYAWMVRKETAQAILMGAFPVCRQVDWALSSWLVSECEQVFRMAPNHLLFFSPKSEATLDSDIQTMVEFQDVIKDPDVCERYLRFMSEPGGNV